MSGEVSPDEPDQLAAPDRFADDLASLHRVATLPPGDPADRLDEWLDAGMGLLSARQGIVLIGTGDELVVRAERGGPPGGLMVDDELADHRAAAALSRRATVASLGGPPDDERDADLGAGSVVASPLWVSGEIAGVVAFVVPVDRGPFSAWQLAVVDVAADGVARVLEHQADVGALVTVESRAAAVIDLIPDPIVRLDRSGRLLDEPLRPPFDPLAAVRPMGSAVDPGPRVRAAIQESLTTGLVQTAVFEAGGPGPERMAEARFVPAGPDEVLCIVRDVTDRLKAERSIAEQVAFEVLLTSISTRLIGCSPATLDDAIEQGLGEIAEFFGADTATVHELAGDGSTLFQSHRWAGPGGAASPGRGSRVPVEGLRWLTDRFERSGHVLERAPEHPDPASVSALLEPDDRGGLWVRLGSAGDISGVFGLTWRSRPLPDDDDLIALARFAADTLHGTIRRRSSAMLAAGQAAVFESIARDAPVSRSLAGAAQLLEDHTLGTKVVVLTVGEDGLRLVEDGPEPGWSGWFAARPIDLSNPYGQAAVTGEPVTVYDAQRDPRFSPDAVPDSALRSAAVLPVRSPRHGRTLALVVLFGCEPGPVMPRSAVRDSALSLVSVALERDHDLRSLAHQATHDPLTGVGNRATLIDRLELALARARRSNRRVAVLFCDLDGFKAVNDRLGHDRGDQLLVEVARRVRVALRPSDTVSRSGGDEFVVVCDDLEDPAQADQIADRIRASVQGTPVVLGGIRYPVSISVGVAVVDDATAEPDRLLRAADIAMYEEKARTRRTDDVALGSAADGSVLPADEQPGLTAAALREAMAGDQLDLYQQPIVGRDGALAGVEVLLRWHRPDDIAIGPEQIVGAADHLDMALPLGRWVRRRALAVRSGWPTSSRRLVRPPIHVNVSGAELRSPGFVDTVDRDLEQSGVTPENLVLEVREIDLHRVEARTAVADLHHLGVPVLVDGAGEGGMPLADLAHLPVSGIKLAHQLVRGLDQGDAGVEVVRSLVLLAHGLGWRSMAVGVETDHQRSVLFGFGVEAVQGRAVAMPVPKEAFRDWLLARDPA